MTADSSCCSIMAENLLRSGDFFSWICASMRRNLFQGHPGLPSSHSVWEGSQSSGLASGGESEPVWFSPSRLLLLLDLPVGSAPPSVLRAGGGAQTPEKTCSVPAGVSEAKSQPPGCRSTARSLADLFVIKLTCASPIVDCLYLSLYGF